MKLYPHQKDWLNGIVSDWESGAQAVCGQAPTGFGKTVCLAHLAKRIAASHKTITILVHRQEIFLQTCLALINVAGAVDPICSVRVHNLLLKDLCKAGMVFGGTNSRSPIRIASIQTLVSKHNRLQELPQSDYVFVDECHHMGAKTWTKIVNHYADSGSRILGVTATPCRLDGVGLGVESGGVFESLVLGPSTKSLIENGFLSPMRILKPSKQITVGDGQKIAGDWRMTDAIISQARKITGDCIKEYKKYVNGKPALVFTPSVSSAKEMAAEFIAGGVEAACVDGSMTEDIRQERLEGLANGKIQVITSCEIISEGMDVPAVEAAFLCRPTMSYSLYLQQIGRALRVSPGKGIAWIFDHVDNVGYHGHPLEPFDWTLDGEEIGQAKKPTARSIMCKECLTLNESRATVCVGCGAGLINKGAGRTYQTVSGDLVDDDQDLSHQQRTLAGALSEAWQAVSSHDDPQALRGEIESVRERFSLSHEWRDGFITQVLSWKETPLGSQSQEHDG